MASNLNLQKTNTLVPASVPVNDLVSNLNDIWDNFTSIQTQFNTLNSEVGRGFDVNGDQHFVSANYDSATKNLTFDRQNGRRFVVNIGDTPTTVTLSELILTDIPTNIDDGSTLVGDHVLTYHVSNFGLIQSLALFVNAVEIHSVTLPTADGRQTANFNISTAEWNDILIGNPLSLGFQLQGTDTGNQPITSNTVTVNRTGDNNKVFYGLTAANNPASIDLSTLTSHVIQGSGTSFDITLGPTTAGQFIQIIYPQTHLVTAIENLNFNGRDVLATFTVSTNVRVEEGQAFDAAVFGPTNAGLTQRYRINLS